MNGLKNFVSLLGTFILFSVATGKTNFEEGQFLPIQERFQSTKPLPVNQVVQLYQTHQWQKNSYRGKADFERWFIANVPENIPQNSSYILEIPEHLADEIDVYLLDGELVKHILSAGDERPFSQRILKTRTPSCMVTLSGTKFSQPKFLVRYVRHGVANDVPMRLWTVSAYQNHSHNIEWLFGLIYGILLLYFLSSLFWALIEQDSLFLIFGLFILFNTLFNFLTAGFGKSLIYPEWVGFNTKFRIFILFASAYSLIKFSLRYMKIQSQLKWIRLYNNASFILITVMFALTMGHLIPAFDTSQNKSLLLFEAMFFLDLLLLIYIGIWYAWVKREWSLMHWIIGLNAVNTVIFIKVYYTVKFLDSNIFLLSMMVIPLIEVTIISWHILQRLLQNFKKVNLLHLRNYQLQIQANQSQSLAIESERKRISHEIHDDILNRLTMVKMLQSSGKLNQEQLLNYLTNINADLRNYAYKLFPPWIEEDQLPVILEQELKQLENQHSIETHCAFYDLITPYSPLVKINVCRIIQQFADNAIKHGKATRLSVECYERDQQLIVTATENGQGYLLSQTTEGIGLKSVKARMDVMKGNLEIDTQPGHGVVWILQIPLV